MNPVVAALALFVLKPLHHRTLAVEAHAPDVGRSVVDIAPPLRSARPGLSAGQ